MEEKLASARAALLALEAQHISETAAVKKDNATLMDRIIQASQKKKSEPPQLGTLNLTEPTPYEVNRLSNIARNTARLREIGLEPSWGEINAAVFLVNS